MLIPSVQEASGLVIYHEAGEQEAALYASMSRGGAWDKVPAELRGLALRAARVLDDNEPPMPRLLTERAVLARYHALLDEDAAAYIDAMKDEACRK